MIQLLFYIRTLIWDRETRVAAWLLLFSFFMGIAFAVFSTVSISLFLTSFSGTSLPYVYLLSGLLSFGVWRVYYVLGKKKSFSGLLKMALLFLFGSVTLLTVMYYYGSAWVSLLLLAWVSPFLFIKNVSFRGMASKLSDISKGKLLFGVIRAGEMLCNSIGFLFVPILLAVVGATGLLVISILSLLFCIVLVLFLMQKNEAVFSDTALPVDKDLNKKAASFHTYKFSPLVAFSLLPVFVSCFIDYIFLNLVQIQFVSFDRLTLLVGYYLGIVSVAELFFRSVIFTRVLRRYGLKAGLHCLPVSLGFSMLLAILAGIWLEHAYLFFFIVALSKLLERSLHQGIHQPATQILCKPLSLSDRAALQDNAVGTSGGSILAGGILLLLPVLGFTMDLMYYHYSYVLLVVLSGWIILTGPLYNVYKRKFQAVLLLKQKAQYPMRKLVFSKHIFKKGFTSSNASLVSASARLLNEIGRTKTAHAEKTDRLEERVEDEIEKEVFIAVDYTNVAQENDALKELELLFSTTDSAELKMKILYLYLRIGTGKAKDLLLDKLEYPDREFQHAAIRLLYALHYTALPSDRLRIRQKIAEMFDTITWLNAGVRDLACDNRAAALVRVLRVEIKDCFNTVYRLLSFLYGYDTIELIKTYLMTKSDQESHLYAQDVALNTFDSDIAALVAPWFERLSAKASLEDFPVFSSQRRLTVLLRAIDILHKDCSTVTLWTKANALKLLGVFYNDDEAQLEIMAHLFHKDALIHEIAFDLLSKSQEEEGTDSPHAITVYDKVLLLKDVPPFHILPEYKLISFASLFDLKVLKAGSCFVVSDDCIVILSGKVSFQRGSQVIINTQSRYTFIQGINVEHEADHFIAEVDSTILTGSKSQVLILFFEDPVLSRCLLTYIAKGIEKHF